MHVILITGVCGFVGTELAEYLVMKSYLVIGLDMQKANSRLEALGDRYRHHIHDLVNKDTTNVFFDGIIKIDLVIHLAGVTRVKDAKLRPREAIEHNILATINIYLSYQEYNRVASTTGSFLFVSTSELENISTSRGTASVYSITKRCTEDLIKSVNDPAILSTSILRLCTVYGGKMEFKDKLPRIFLEQVKRHEKIIINSNIKINPSFIYINDLLLIIEKVAVKLLLDKTPDFKLETCTVSGEESSLGELVMRIEKILNKSIDHSYLPDCSSATDAETGSITYRYSTIRAEKPIDFSVGLKRLWDIVNED